MARPADLHPSRVELPQPSRDRAWRPAGEAGSLPEDPVLADWLTHPGSLTRRLRSARAEGFEFTVLGEGWEPSMATDRRALGVGDAELYVRRIRMGLGGRPLVHACTVVPAATVRRHPWLTGLGSAPLGDTLSRRGGVRRSAFEYAAPAETPGDHRADVCGLWGRRSSFVIDGTPLLVYEFLFPALATLGSGV